MPKKTIQFYFDYISPYAYFQWHQLKTLGDDVAIDCKPVLFAGLLKHWGQLGPAEIAPKRVHLYQQCVLMSRVMNIPFAIPPAHPFRPLSALRLTLATGCDAEVIDKLFESVWVTGEMPDNPESWANICRELGIQDADKLIADSNAKQALIDNTQTAVENDVFGVPTIRYDGQLFWGVDMFEFFKQCLAGEFSLRDSEFAKAVDLPTSASRSQGLGVS